MIASPQTAHILTPQLLDRARAVIQSDTEAANA